MDIIFSEFTRIMDITWQKAIWGIIWALIFWGLYTGVLIVNVYMWARQMFIKYELPRINKGEIQKKDDEIKSLKIELRLVKAERRDYLDRLLVVKNSSEVNQ